MSLTIEQTARIYAMYLGSELVAPNPFNDGEQSKGYLTGITAVDGYFAEIQFNDGFHAEEEEAYELLENCKLLLKPVSAISDADAIEVAKINFGIIEGNGNAWYLKEGKKYLQRKVFLPYHIFQYLTQQGYAVPLFIAPNHPDNGKTALELGLANLTKQEVHL